MDETEQEYYAVTFSDECGFNNKKHLQNHIAYLCRTDKNQKWTNELTALNLAYIFGDTADFVEFGMDKRVRFDIASRITKQLKSCGAFKKKEALSHLLMQRVEYANDSIRLFDRKMFGDLRTIIETISRLPNIVPVALVTHCDQKDCYVHFHLLYLSYSDTPLFELLYNALPE